MLVVDGTGDPSNGELQSWEGLQVDGIAADRGNVVPTDLVVALNLR